MHRLQSDLITLEQWASKWIMVFNPTKCEFLRVTNKTNPILMQYIIQGQVIQEVTSAKYLGITIDQHLTWNNHVKLVTNKTNGIKYFLQQNLKHCPRNIKVNCYKSLVRSIIEYAAMVWAPYIVRATSMPLKLYREEQQDLFSITIQHMLVLVI